MRLFRSVKFAQAGLREAFFNHPNFRWQLALAAGAAGLGMVLGLSAAEWAILSLTFGLVLAAEMANSSIEAVVDLITQERRLKAQIAKDLAAGMVFLSAVISVIVGILLFGPRIF